jgi:CubicO group peptidase (beta-lactamase class C family)
VAERTAPARTGEARFAALGACVRAGMARYHVPGAALGVIDGEAEHLAGFGLTSVEQPLPVDGETPFPVASITKTAVATAVLRLVERGHLALEQPLRRYLPELRLRDAPSTDRLTLLHLLTHTGGFQGDVRDGAYGVRCGAGDDALARFLELLAHLPQHAHPGEVWAYNNAGFSLAGRVIEVVTGQPFEVALRELVLEPLGMRRSSFLPARPPESIGPGQAVGHTVRAGRAEVVRRGTLPRLLAPAGGLVCPPSDLLRYARFHLGDGAVAGGGRLLSPESMALMQRPRAGDALHNGCLASFADEVGLSWFSRGTDQGRLLVHGGWSSLALRLTLVPARRYAVFVLTNADTGAQLHAEVTKHALRDYVGIAGLDAVPLPSPPADPAPYAGTYRFAAPDDEDVELRVHGDRLTSTEWGDAAFYAPDRIVVLEGLWRHERGQFLRGADGRIACLRIGGGLGWRSS